MEGGKRIHSNFTLDKSIPSLSIITVVYNSQEFIERTIRSVQSQTFKNIEHVILDGGSKDQTLDIIKSFEQGIAYWKSEKDEGIYDAMNKAQLLATGDYVMFLNSGDELNDHNVIEEIFKLQANADVYYGDTLITDVNGQALKNRRLRPPQTLTWKDLRYGMLVCHQSIIVKRSISQTYNTEYRISADIDWAIRSLKLSHVIVNTHRTISKFMEGGMSTIHQRKGLEERYKVLNKHFGYVPNALVHVYMIFRLVFSKLVR